MKIHTPKCIIVIFGATGDLAKRKLFPSLYRLFRKGKISEDFAVVGVARRPLSNDEFRENVKTSIRDFHKEDMSHDTFASHFYYHPFDVTNISSYQELKNLLTTLDGSYHTEGNRMFYLAMAPDFFGTIATHLKSEGLTSTEGWIRLVIEKPFGHDYESAQVLNNQIRHAFTEDEIYRIDHYLGKEMVQNIKVIRFANAIFEPLWNNQYIANIQITSSEVLGVEDRGRYYEDSGALRDMVQNHVLQMVALLAMEPPIKLTAEEIRSEKVKVLRALKPLSEDAVDRDFIRGQYGPGIVDENKVIGYREENAVDPESNTETFVAGKLMIEDFRWSGVPFYIRTGKRMQEKCTEIVIQFKDLPMNLYFNNENKVHPNLLVIHIQPEEGITLYLNAKKAESGIASTPIQLSYCNNCTDKMNTPEAYEVLLYDCMRGDSTNFTHWDEVSLSWQFVDVISNVWNNKSAKHFPNYESGSMGPKESDALLENDGFHWWPTVTAHLKGENTNGNI
ncbi:glucose-6-phosphate dehydrogenase [Bacillus sp. DX1.1]|uniref:glucose-6-phosphate dehydrogenase n=1 Tax=unclassified Bacillus (in: firmicutes) TaxID=185979 RepID=UPI00256FCCB2|nr:MULTISPECIES: glucose-6-phosphate dehydrogenase [unclassified Bacillus (in: firmicutes)]MDM5154940.1 glucose-6-phosphate dehydrogenase [Bacillus sp. DX1.1]WJE83805.1 glucose-6-phosphate dehydrogenase [Bacillus sp. DX3.1]